MSAPRLTKRGSIWHVRFTAPNGQRVQKSTGTSDRALAEEYAARAWSEAYRVANLGQRPRYSWDDAVMRWAQDHAHKRSAGKDATNLDWLYQHLHGVALDAIDTELLRQIRTARCADELKPGRSAGQSTANKMLALVRSILRAAAGWGWLDRVPVVPMFKERKKADPQFLTRDQAAAVLAKLPPHLRQLAAFALATGLREQNVLRLQWSRVDLDARAAWITADETKGARPLRVPLSGDAMVILRQQREAVDKACVWVFPNGGNDGEPYVRANNSAWRTMRDKLGLPWLRFHDLRHTWASWHVMAGTPLEVLQQLGGWRSLAMVMRYAHLAPSHVDSYADRISGPRVVKAKKAGEGN